MAGDACEPGAGDAAAETLSAAAVGAVPAVAEGAGPAVAEVVARAWSAEEVGKRVGKNPRTVRKWTEASGPGGGEPCPCERKPRGKEMVLRFNLEEVIAWMGRHGIGGEGVDGAGGGAPMFELSGECGSSVAEAGGSAPRHHPHPPHSQEGAAPGVDLLADVPVGEERAAFRGTLSDLRRQVNLFAQAVREKNLAGLSHAQIKGLADAAAKASQEIRQIDDADLDLRERRGELVEKAPERRAWGALAGDLVSLLTRLEVDVATEGKMALAEKGCLTAEAAGEGEKVERILREVVRRTCDAERVRLAGVMLAAAAKTSAAPVEQKEAA